ncbi:hypothetical protein EVAR_62293_1 [Eumeta japonica]|uniref:Uncharacterized protein n=1 Tax=Eumeta variegata TaxID=151549 RepID=A0A4C1ZXC2_EUMVA|nr:hypothetical protein EVAR_62293_1 [Eumeta japonica]
MSVQLSYNSPAIAVARLASNRIGSLDATHYGPSPALMRPPGVNVESLPYVIGVTLSNYRSGPARKGLRSNKVQPEIKDDSEFNFEVNSNHHCSILVSGASQRDVAPPYITSDALRPPVIRFFAVRSTGVFRPCVVLTALKTQQAIGPVPSQLTQMRAQRFYVYANCERSLRTARAAITKVRRVISIFDVQEGKTPASL